MNVNLSGESPLYINFSSGTTGKAKGIECLHQGVHRLVKRANYIVLNEQTTMLCASATDFDAFTLEFWGPLLNGGAVYMSLLPIDTNKLQQGIEHQGVNTVWLTAALFHTLVEIDEKSFVGLEQLLVGGDVVSPQHVSRVYRAAPNIKVVNGYGPTENTTFTCCFPIPKHWNVSEALPIGRPINGTGILILNSKQMPVATGCIGEIVVTGLGLAGRYLDADLEAECFISLELPEGRFRAYRTGDLGYLDNEEQVRFLGRRDSQVKINGFRIELTGINQSLLAHSSVQRAETLVIETGETKSLISFVLLTEQNEAKAPVFELKFLVTALSERLPSYQLPKVVLAVPNMPITANGKLDRRALLAYFY
ncbi:AMP-binding protein, partial [uncultured Shewanella sp.]|uniref:AMP-binding protein n=1 Tax=uncultured Shewanella sp. TaxID=173975 RepID=UPI0026277271